MHGLLIAGGVGPCPLLCALLLQLIKSKRCSADCRTHGLGARHSAVAAKACCTYLPPLQAPIPTKMIVSASLASVLVRCYGLLLKQGDIGARAACCSALTASTASTTSKARSS